MRWGLNRLIAFSIPGTLNNSKSINRKDREVYSQRSQRKELQYFTLRTLRKPLRTLRLKKAF